MGTLAYMRLNRHRASPVDARADIFSFGALLYEMATGQRAFAGKTPAETLSAVMQSQPTLRAHSFLRCLTISSGRSCGASARIRRNASRQWPTSGSIWRRSRRIRIQPYHSGHDRTVRTATGIGSHGSPAPGGGCCGRMVVEHPRLVEVGVSAGCAHERALTRLTTAPGLQTDVTFSPDGRLIAYAWTRVATSISGCSR